MILDCTPSELDLLFRALAQYIWDTKDEEQAVAALLDYLAERKASGPGDDLP